jgi:hypothetical protein
MTFNHTEVIATFLNPEKLAEQEKHIQVISMELMEALSNAAKNKAFSLDVEVINRLLATIIEPNAFGLSPQLDKIAHKKIVGPEIQREQQRNREAWGRLYELEKLERYLRFKRKMPKSYQEHFSLIDVKKESARIEAMLAEEQRGNDDH